MKAFTFVSDMQVFRHYTAKGDFSCLYKKAGEDVTRMTVEKDSLVQGGARCVDHTTVAMRIQAQADRVMNDRQAWVF